MSPLHRLMQLVLSLAIGGVLCAAPLPGFWNALSEPWEQDTESAGEETVTDSLEEGVRHRDSRRQRSAARRRRRLAEKLHGRCSHAPQHELARVLKPVHHVSGHRLPNGLNAPLLT